MENNNQLLHNYLLEADKIKAGEGLIIIPDISGYTEFVSGICIEAGRYITYQLLSTLMENNILGMHVSEIEGDAILFYRFGTRPSAEKVLLQYELMLKAFLDKLSQIEAVVGRKLGLSLKLIAHYGQISEYQISHFRKLYGAAVITAHSLLKNTVKSKTYALLTNDLTRGRETSTSYQDFASCALQYSVYNYH